MIIKKSRLSTQSKQIICLFLTAILLMTLLSGCKTESSPSPDVKPPSSSSAESGRQSLTSENDTLPSSSTETTQASSVPTQKPPASNAALPSPSHTQTTQKPSTPASRQNSSARKIAKKRIQSDIDLALWYVNENRDNGSKVSFPYKQGKTAYSKLSKAQKKRYNEMLPKVQTMTPFKYTAKEYGYTVLDNVLVAASALCHDHPECEIYFDIEEVFSGDMTTALRASYFLPGDPDSKNTKDTAAIKKEIQIFEEECNLIIEAIPKKFSTYDKYRYLAAVISIRTAYDNEFVGGKQTSTAYGAIQGGTSICQGYSTAFEYLCRKANLWCRQVSGTSYDVSHAWNLVKLESGTYHVDVTWADADQNLTLDSGWQRYFMLTQEEILADHEIDDGTVATGTPLT